MVGNYRECGDVANQQDDQDHHRCPSAVAFLEANESAQEYDPRLDPSSRCHLVNGYGEQQDKIEGCELRAVRLTIIQAHEVQKPIHH